MKYNVNKIFKRLKEGDPQAFDILYETASKSVYYMALSVVKDSFAAEEVMQDTFIKALNNLNLFDENKNAMNWLLTIAKNLAINRYNKMKKEISVEPKTLYDCKIHIDEDNSLIDFAMNNLSETEFSVLMLCELKGYKRREVAKMLDMPLPTVTWHYKKAINNLKILLEKEV